MLVVSMQASLPPPTRIDLSPSRVEPAEPRAPTLRGEGPFLAHWLARHPPGWISRHTAENADPLRLAGEIQFLSTAFVAWLRLPRADRWDNYNLQALSASLFNSYRFNGKGNGPGRGVDLFDLDWPGGTTDIRHRLMQMRQLLAGPFAVFKAMRSAVAEEEFPSQEDVSVAEATLVARLTPLEGTTRQLHGLLERFRSETTNVSPMA